MRLTLKKSPNIYQNQELISVLLTQYCIFIPHHKNALTGTLLLWKVVRKGGMKNRGHKGRGEVTDTENDEERGGIIRWYN